MASSVLIFITVVLFIIWAYKYATYKPRNFPPGPPRIPMFGSYLFLMMLNPKYLHKGALILSKIYKSKVIGLWIGGVPTIIANSYEGVKEILYRQEFDGRPNIFAAKLRDPNFQRKGIFFTEGPVWKEQRRFILRHLRDFGFGRRFEDFEIFINEEILDLLDVLKNGPKYQHEHEFFKPGQALCPYFMSPFTNNCFLKVFCGEKFSRAEQSIIYEIAKNGMKFQRNGDDYGKLVSIMPWIRHYFPEKSSFKPLRDASLVLHKYMREIVDNQMKSFDENYERNFIDLYIKEMKEEEAKGGDTTFLYDQFILSIVDFMFPALTAIPVQISLLFQWFLLRPDILKNVQDEIDDIVGSGRLPTLDDRINMPYTEATVRECLRIETLVPSDVPHTALVETDFLGYTVPQGTIMIPSLHAFHLDKDVWQDPDVFKPERFLDYNGKLSLKKDISLPFGAGKRLCAGETFARNLLFLMTSALCQHFDIILGPSDKLPDMSKTLSGLIISPPDFWLTLKAR